jgi:DNA polymerase-3 subunit beta
MTCKVTVQKSTFADSLAIVGRAVGAHTHLPILSNVLLSKQDGQLRLSATDLTLCVTVWMDANMDGDLGLTLPARILSEVVNTLTEPEVTFSVNGKPEAALKCGAYKGVVKGIEASEFPMIPEYDTSNGISMDAGVFKDMIRKVAFAASLEDTRPVLNGVLMSLEGNSVTMVGTDGFRLAICKAMLPGLLEKKQLIIPASALKEVVRILGTIKASRVTLILPLSGNQLGIRCENVQMVVQLIDGKFPDYQSILPNTHKTRTVIATEILLKACKQASIIARDGNNVVSFHLQPNKTDSVQPGTDQTGKVKILAKSDETGKSEIELDASVEGQDLEIAFNVKFLQDGLEAVSSKNVVIEANAANTPAVIRASDDQDFIYILMPMHMDGK